MGFIFQVNLWPLNESIRWRLCVVFGLDFTFPAVPPFPSLSTIIYVTSGKFCKYSPEGNNYTISYPEHTQSAEKEANPLLGH